MRDLRRPVAWWAALVMMASLAAASDVGIDRARADAKAVVADTYALEALRNMLIRQLAASVAADKDAGCLLRLELKGALNGANLSIELARRDGQFLSASGFLPEFHNAAFRLEAPGLKLDGDTLKGEIGLHLQLPPQHRVVRTLQPYECAFRIDATIKGGQVEGQYTTAGAAGDEPIPPGQSSATGSVIPRRPPQIAPRLENQQPIGESLDAYSMARWAEAKAAGVYREIRALDLTIRHRLPHELALKQAAAYVPNRPTFTRKDLKGPQVPSVDDVDLGREVRPPPSVIRPEAFKTLASMRSAVGRMRQYAQQSADTVAAPAVAVGGLALADDRFGPWYGTSALSGAVPAHVDDGPQAWSYVPRWRVLGPVARHQWSLDTPLLPEIVEAIDATYTLDVRGLIRQASTEETEWAAIDAEEGSGRIIPPTWDPGKRSQSGVERGGFFAVTQIDSEREQELYASVGVNDYAKLYTNGRLVWTSPATRPAGNEEQSFLLKLPLAKGSNHLLVRCDNDSGHSFFRLSLCTRGKPGPTARPSPPPPSPLAALRGWRGDWGGNFPEATPVTAWNIEKNINIVWRVPMRWNNCTPMIVGNKLFTAQEPHTLVCLDKADGKLLWQKDSNILELIDPSLLKEYDRLVESAYKSKADLAADEEKREAQVLELQGQGLTAEQIEKKLGPPAGGAALWKLLQEKASVPRPGWGDYYGHTMPTPVTDGKLIWVKYGTGVVACYDLDGKRQWMVDTLSPAKDHRSVPSPLLAGGKLIMELPPPGPRGGGAVPTKGGTDAMVLLALDAATGKELWRQPTRNPELSASPLLMRLSNGTSDMDVVLTGGGSVVRADDGRMLIPFCGWRAGNGTPVVKGDVVYYTSSGGNKAALRLFMVDRDTVGCRPLWSSYIPGEFSGGMVLHQGMLYGLTGGQEVGPLQVIDVATGRRVLEMHDLMPTPGRAYMPPAAAGRYLFGADDARIFAWVRTMPGTMVVVDAAGAESRVVARNFMEGLHAAPVFEGDRMYVRTRQSIMCIGPTGGPGGAGEAYEAAVNARTLLEAVYGDRLTPDAATAIAPAGPLQAQRKGAPSRLPLGELLTHWLFAGPWPIEEAQAVLASMGGPREANPVRGTEVKHKGTRAFEPFDVRSYVQNDWFGAPAIDLAGPNLGRPNTVSYYVYIFNSETPRTLRVELTAPPDTVDLWLAGTPLRHGQRVKLEAGRYNLLMQVRLRHVPPADEKRIVHLPPRLSGKRIIAPEAPASGVTMSLRFWPSDDAAEEQRQWQAFIARYRPMLERAANLAPQSVGGAKARAVLMEATGPLKSGM